MQVSSWIAARVAVLVEFAVFLISSTKLFAAALRGGRFSLLAWLIPYENGHVLGKQAENPLSSVGESWGMACRVARGARSVGK